METMNNTMHTIEDTDDVEMAERIGSIGMSVKPREEALRAALKKMPDGIPTPYPVRTGSAASFGFRKIAAMALALVILIGGGALYTHRSGTSPLEITPLTIPDGGFVTSPTDASDTAIASDVGSIDSQLATLSDEVTLSTTIR